MFKISGITLAVALTLSAAAQAQNQTQVVVDPGNASSTYRINVVSRTTRAVSYRHRSGSTKINFQGTDLMPAAAGEAKVESKRGALEIEVEFSGLDRPTSFGGEYLTYVLWAISPEGRPINIGEVLVGENRRSKLDVTTDLQAFALIVTAEPYYAVRRPSNVVVLENVMRSDTRGGAEEVDAKYELIDRGGYIPSGYRFDPVVLSAKLPLEFFEARNALRIAQSAGAERYAATSYQNAVRQMDEADAREIAVKHIDEERLESERRAGTNREIAAKDREIAESDRRSRAEAATVDAENRRNEADRRNVDAQAAAQRANGAQADAERDRDSAQQKQRAAEADADRDRNAAASSDAQLQQSVGAQANAERDRDDAKRKQRDAEADADRNRNAAASSDAQLQTAVHDREELRARLLQQFNLILETRDTARGLVVNMSDVLFDSGKYTLRPLAREKLAKISGIVLAYPTLRLAIEGNTDSVGTELFNQELSERRAEGVRTYLTQQGVPENSTTASGFGKTRPIASNDTTEGRQQNRRVELIVSG